MTLQPMMSPAARGTRRPSRSENSVLRRSARLAAKARGSTRANDRGLAGTRRGRIPAPAPALSLLPAVQPFWSPNADLAGKTVIYGGSFNPPHTGHLMVCQYLLTNLGAKEVWLMPAYTHADKPNLAAFAARVGMCQLLARNGDPAIKVTDVEAQAPHTGSTYDVMQYVCATYPERSFAFALGSDLAASAPTWSNWDKLTQLVPIALIPRAGHLTEGADTPVAPELSSTEVCRRLRAGESIAEMVPGNVADFIRDNRMYE